MFRKVFLIFCTLVFSLRAASTEETAETAFIYGLPLVMAYNVIFDYSIDKNSGQYKGPMNEIFSEHRVYTPKDTSVVTPNSDTPYSFLLMDLRSEPMVICVPEVEKGRYYSVQLVSLYTFNFGYIGSRATGNDAGCYLVAGPNWQGETPAGIKKVFRSETDLAIAIFRTQLFNPDDMANVIKIQKGYEAHPLSAYTKSAPPPSAPAVSWVKINPELAKKDFFSYLNFLLQFAPPIGTAAVERPLRTQFASIGIEVGKPFLFDDRSVLENAMVSGKKKIVEEANHLGKEENGWRVTTNAFGDREQLKDNWLIRAAAAKAGIFGNNAEEALYPIAVADQNGEPLDGSKHNYTITFKEGELPPVNAFWSVTMYDGKTQLLVENPIHRYLINSPMLPNLKRNNDGSITLYIQKDSPGGEKAANWLPAPDGPIYLVMRLYWPKEEALSGAWKPPVIQVDQQ